MKFRCLALFALAAPFVTACASTSGAGAMDEQAMMAKWGEYATPGEAHHVLDHKVGMWKLKVRMFNPDGSVAGESDATSECGWAMGGRFVVEHTQGSFSGMPFEGHGVSGYDNIKRKYVGSWMDNMSTGLMSFEGTFDANTNTFTFKGQSPDPMAWDYLEGGSEDEQALRDDHGRGREQDAQRTQRPGARQQQVDHQAHHHRGQRQQRVERPGHDAVAGKARHGQPGPQRQPEGGGHEAGGAADLQRQDHGADKCGLGMQDQIGGGSDALGKGTHPTSLILAGLSLPIGTTDHMNSHA